ncbi:MAG TPA: hypothetical protein DDW27_22105 [Bacteroidales bacterium]|nr:hypothetical protein [Bacteroidales bacterium]
MSKFIKSLRLITILFYGLSVNDSQATVADSVTLFTPYTRISVPPGESIIYSIDVINNSKEIRNMEITVTGIPRSWNYSLTSGNYKVGQIAVMPDQKQTLNLKVEVPLKVNKGSYNFKVTAGSEASLSLVVVVTEQGTFETEFTTKQSNMQGHAASAFTFTAELKNRTAEKQLYAFRTNALRGWNVIFKPNYNQATSVEIEPNSTVNVTIEIKPPVNIQAGTYQIPVIAGTNVTSATLNLEVVITGSFNVELTTPTGLLSTDITAGDVKRVELVVKNTGSSALTDVEMTFSAPVNWDVVFDPKKIDRIEAGNNAQVFASIKADRKAIAGDYVTNLEAKTPEVASKATFRISVKTPMLLGWIGVFIILAALGSVYYLFRKYGRR